MRGEFVRPPVRRLRLRPLFACAVAAGVTGWAARPVPAGVVRLKDGTTYEGEIKPERGGYVVTLADGKTVYVAADKVVGLEAKPKAVVGPNASLDRLASLRRAVENVPDLRQVVDRYKAFIAQHAGTPGAEQAQADLRVWQDRLDRRLTKVGEQWLSDLERQQLAERSFRTAEQAMDLLRQNRPTEAAPVVEQALAENGQNPAAWYLRGLLLWKQDRAPDARKAFDQVVALAPDSAAGHNNLAVVQWRQTQHVAALLSYDRALLAAPQSLVVLDNLAEALHALPADLRTAANVRKVVRHFNDQESLVRPPMEARGLFRWGSSWVTKAEYDRLLAVEREILDKIDRMEADYNALATRVQQLDRDVASLEATIRRMEADAYAFDPATNRTVRYPMPASYYTFVRDLGTAKAERAQRATEQQQMRRQANQLVQTMPTPRYTGVQRVIETDGTPVIGKPAAGGPAGMPVAAGGPGGAGGVGAAGQPVPAAPVAPGGPAGTGDPATAPVAGGPQGQGATPAASADTALGLPGSPAVPEVDWPSRRRAVPPEKPSILDRRLSDPPPPAVDQPLLDERNRP
jgi:tetratricopeptide (TPR) repeat protein